VFSLVLIVAIAVGYVARRSQLAGERDVALTTAAELGASQLGSLIDVVETATLAGTDATETTAALAGSFDELGVCSISDEEVSCTGDGAPDELADDRFAALEPGDSDDGPDVIGRAVVDVYESSITIEVDGPSLTVIARAPVGVVGGRSDVALWAATLLPEGVSIGGFAVEQGVRQTATPVPGTAQLFVAAAGSDAVELPQDEQVFYALIFGLAVTLLVLAGATLFAEQRNLLERASFDPLTRLPNRSEFERRASEAIADADRDESELCVLLFDLNGFKLINDNYGHHTGDLMLQTVAERLRKAVRGADVVARWGGDEFVVAMPGITSEEMGARRARQLAESVSGRTRLESVTEPLRVKVSVGVALWPHHGDDLDSLIEAADKAMYQAKREGTTCRIADAPPPVQPVGTHV
jgi:diguanylate cyclase (GGDEF)-like protein